MEGGILEPNIHQEEPHLQLKKVISICITQQLFYSQNCLHKEAKYENIVGT